MNDTSNKNVNLHEATVVTGFVLLVYFNFRAARQLQQENARLKTIEHFAELQQRQDRVASEIELMRRQLRTMYYTCRNAEDFFGVFDHEIASVANVRHSGTQWDSLQVLINVPQEGSHRLRVVVTQGSPEPKETDLYRKTIPLESGQTFEIKLKCDRTRKENGPPRNVTLKMDEDEIELPIPQFPVGSSGVSSSGNREFFRQPNQQFAFSDEKSHNKIVDRRFGGSGENEKVRIRIFVDSEGPKRSAADNAETVRELIDRLYRDDSGEKVLYDPRGWYTFE